MKYLLILVSLSLALTAKLDPKKILVAINCGSSAGISAVEGFKYTPDTGLVQGDSKEADYSTNELLQDADIKYTFQKEIYMTERHTYAQMAYKLPIKEGLNTIILKFAEMYFTEKGKRVFDVLIGSTVVLKNFDVFAEAGHLGAADKYIEVQMKQQKLFYKGEQIKDGMDKGKVKLVFKKGKADNPIIQGIVMYHSSLEESNYNQYTALKTKWSQQKEMLRAKKQEQEIKDLIAVQKKKEKVAVRNDQLQITDEDEATPVVASPSSRGFIRSLMMSPLGVLVWAVLISCGIVFLHNNVFLMGTQIKA